MNNISTAALKKLVKITSNINIFLYSLLSFVAYEDQVAVHSSNFNLTTNLRQETQ